MGREKSSEHRAHNLLTVERDKGRITKGTQMEGTKGTQMVESQKGG
jgi:hypothetical protein